MTLRQRLLLTLLPTLLLLAALGTAGAVLLHHLGNRIGDILSENYDSVVFMVDLNEALERIDSSFTYALLGEEQKARAQYRANWAAYDVSFDKEANNITLPGEQELVDELRRLSKEYRKAGDRFFRPGRTPEQRRADYFGASGKKGLLAQFEDIKRVSRAIRELNQQNMVDASHEARRTATASLYGFGIGLAATALLAGLLAWSTVRATLRPIQEMTRSALAIGAGNLNQIVPVRTRDELGALADAFNDMARQLRAFRQSHLAQLLRAQRTAQATIDSFPDPVLVVDPEGRVEMANPAARRVLGATPAADSPPAPFPWQPPEPLAGPLREALQQHRPFLTQAFDQTVAFRLDGEERTFLPQVLPIEDPYGITLGAAVVLNDVTRFRLLDQFKSDLVATVSHELKTPLTSVRLVLHLLLEETVGPLTPKQTELLVDARDNAERLLHIIEHLLALARLQQGKDVMALRPEPAQALLEAAAESARPRAESRQVELTVRADPGLPPLAADPQRLGQALNNLLDNALTYTPPGGRVTLSAEPAGGGRVQLSVADTGEGIPPEHLPHVFERFFRVPGRSRGQGTGLGLAIVREVVNAHGGEVACDSAPGRGTTFRLTLPAWSGDGG